ncbi:MAG: O-succinylhomoserine sulfhydrylase [Flavobacteriales bacterium MED-G22]|nr:aminotransferase class I/II-fold pyridoxal phosphate-dependent enzyme [Flavobacteriaceae bacterium]PDH44046.1 MAG: O-succinylhomoserine sulfhydrylase [Flavobacteriales bacterium MED-G22]|tara:strand:- start:3141 stop:4307 length:1167 start_codon:yes stop_codon:yes gene_type:complete
MKRKVETQAIHTQMDRSDFLEHSTPMHLTSSFVFEDAEDMRASFAEEKQRNIYSRFTNPNNDEFIEKVCLMEGAQRGVAFASGMAAVYSTFAALLKAGDHILSSRSIFGSTYALFNKYFPKWDINTSYFEWDQINKIGDLIQPTTKILYVESPTNPGVDIIDLQLLGDLAKKHNLIYVVDNCFATPYLQQPIRFGADLVIHSATKLIDGQGRVLGGVTVGSVSLVQEIYLFARNTGPSLSPFNSWILSKSLETLAVRIDRHCSNALSIAERLEKHTKINYVKYPFLKSHPQFKIAKKQMRQGGNVIAFEILGGEEKAIQFIDNLKMCSITSNLGDSRSIVTHPASSTHSKLSVEERLLVGITPGLIRLSVGLEHIDDLWHDVEQALNV